VKSGEIWAGAPAKLLRKLSAEEKGFVAASADNYAKLATEHRSGYYFCYASHMRDLVQQWVIAAQQSSCRAITEPEGFGE
jgi:hypothetical protein